MQADTNPKALMEIQLRLTIRILNSRIEQLETELATLKANIAQSMIFDTIVCEKTKRCLSEQARDKLEYYHQNKDTAIKELSKKHGLPAECFSWTCVKKYTDKQKESETAHFEDCL